VGASEALNLPDPSSVPKTVRTWAASSPQLSTLLRGGQPMAQALARWGQALLRETRPAEAGAAFRSALALAPDDAMLWTNYGVALDQDNQPAAAAQCLERSLTLTRQQPDSWLLLGMVKTKLGDLPGAEASYQVALELLPNSSLTHQLLGLLKQQQRDHTAAIAHFVACLENGGATPGVWANLGKLYYQAGLVAEAHAAYEQASSTEASNLLYRQMTRKTRFLAQVLGERSLDDAIATFQSSFAPPEQYLEKELQDLLNSSFSFLSGFGHAIAATRIGQKQMELWPASPSLSYLLKAVAGDPAVDRSAPEYVVAHFDDFAEGFDAQLVGALGYDIPEKICAAVREVTGAEPLEATLDAGCGTGLCGPLLRPFTRTLSGVDLSPKMLEQAAKRAVYDALACEELTAFLSRESASFDLIVAADVLVYFGDLAALFAAAATALKPGGLLACSTEWQAGSGYRVQPSGRFAHAPGYVLATAEPGFSQVACIETTIRMEATKRLVGNVFVFRRRSPG
jgi:predicted TPR repeat methyltransferase